MYELHQNNPDDPHYRQFLSPASEAVKKYCIKNGRGLDVGCGPGPTLSLMLNELGYAMDVYDKFFMPDQSVFTNHYDFITCTEVIEHIDQLDQFLQLLLKSLSAGGYLIFMTKIFAQDTEFKTWYYKDDPTHISFITKETVQYMASHYGLNLKELTRQLIVFQKGQ